MLPLSGITVLDLSRLLPGPMCSLHLQDMGARVIKVEDTGAGDYARTLGMPPGYVSPAFHIMNRSKESISIDLSKSEGLAIFKQLVEKADVVLETFRPGVLDKLGIGYEALKQVNPQIIVCSISGYGQTGPWANKAGHDMNYCATAGILEQMGNAGEAPALGNFQIADLAGGTLSAAMAILAAIIGRLKNNEGCYLDVSMTDCAFANHVIPLANMAVFKKTHPRGKDMLTGSRPCYSVYKTADDLYMAVGALEKKFWEQVCDLLEREDWKKRYNDMGPKAEELRAEVAAVFASKTQDEWRDFFAESDCCVTPILSPEKAFEHPQLLAREMVREIKTPQGFNIKCPNTPFMYNGKKPDVVKGDGLAPEQGRDTTKILQEFNFTEEQIQQLLTTNVIRQQGVKPENKTEKTS